MIMLAVDASTYVGTTAVLSDGQLLAHGEAAMRGRDAEALMPAIAATLDRAGKSPRELSRVVCGAGPGSFTSLRIAASLAKGLALGARCPMFAVSSLALIVAATGRPPEGRYLAVLDALRGDAYVGGYAVDARGLVTSIFPERLVMQSEVHALAEELHADTIGPAQKIDRAPHARGIVALETLLQASGPVDLARWEPDYGRKAEAQARWEAAHGRPLPPDASSLIP
jgi:tRNA threonylcarbamoyladenosine biosynthesis protein TsaB